MVARNAFRTAGTKKTTCFHIKSAGRQSCVLPTRLSVLCDNVIILLYQINLDFLAVHRVAYAKGIAFQVVNGPDISSQR